MYTNVSFSGLNLASKRFRLEKLRETKRFRYFIYLMETYWIIGCFASFRIFSSVIVFFVSLPVLAILAVVFVVGRHRTLPLLEKLLRLEKFKSDLSNGAVTDSTIFQVEMPPMPSLDKEAATGNSMFKSEKVDASESKSPNDIKSARRINAIMYETLIYGLNVTNITILVAMVVLSISGSLYAYFMINDWREYSPPDMVSPVMVVNELIFCSVLLAMYAIANYALRVVKARPLERLRRRLTKKYEKERRTYNDMEIPHPAHAILTPKRTARSPSFETSMI